MYNVYISTNMAEVSAKLWWDLCIIDKTNMDVRIFYNRKDNHVVAATPNHLMYDKLAYDPSKYRYVGRYTAANSPDSPRDIERDLQSLRAEIKRETPIQSSLGRYQPIIERSYEDE